ncbi:MAG TPA: hypothetical protein VL985_02245 [Stellaceae bacterium]|nr:hypothetical protein [Stellaceae bacterium]
MSDAPFPRRHWLFGVMSLGIMATRLSRGAGAAERTEDPRERMRKRLVSLLHEPERARKVGAVYLRSPTQPLAPPAELDDEVLAELGPEAGDDALRRFIVARIRRELRDAQVISLDGWILSPTEARLCRLAAVA